MGELAYYYDNSYGGFYGGIQGVVEYPAYPSMLCDKYPYKGMFSNVSDKELGYIYSNNFFVKDSDFGSDTSAIKEGLQGVLLNYELAEPIVVELDENINLDYLVWDFGTEEVVSSASTTKFKGDIIYQFNAVDRIRDCSRVTIKDNGNIVLLGKEFMPATPSGDPMHYVYLSYQGVSYDAESGLYSLGYLNDLTAEDMRKAFATYGGGVMSIAYNSRVAPATDNARFAQLLPRTTLPSLASPTRLYRDKVSFSFSCSELEQLYIGILPSLPNSDNVVKLWRYESNELIFSFYEMKKLKYIVDILNCNESYPLNIFSSLPSLEEIRLSYLQNDVTFGSPNLSYESLHYMIERCAEMSSITIYVHQNVYDKIFKTKEWYSLSDLCAEMKDSIDTDIQIKAIGY